MPGPGRGNARDGLPARTNATIRSRAVAEPDRFGAARHAVIADLKHREMAVYCCATCENSGLAIGSAATNRPFRSLRLSVRTPPFHGGESGSIPLGSANCPTTSQLMPDHHLQFDGARVLADLNALRGIGAYKTGVHKPTFSEPHLRSLHWLAERLPEAGLAAEIDGIGNVLGISTKSGPKLLAGSHLESQNYAGWLDGPLGVVYALEAARVINPDSSTNGAVEVASWCDEEGHFGHLLGSRSYVGAVTEDEIDAARDRTSGKTLRQALREVGLAGRARANTQRGRHIGYLEAHIEQGETLETGNLKIGVVTSIVGIWQYRITFTGEQNHAGTTRMGVRKDAGLALARFCVPIDDRFPMLSGPRTVWTTGRITLDPGAPSIIPGAAEMLFQIRDDDPDVIERLENVLR